jgi:hypothetical protein
MMNNVLKILLACTFIFCMGCGDEGYATYTDTIENHWWAIPGLSYCFSFNTASQKLWYVTYYKGSGMAELHEPANYTFEEPNYYSWESTDNLYGSQMNIVNNGECWDQIYWPSMWSTVCKCETIPQEKTDSLTSHINNNYSVDGE